jgi:hypothetical protein
MIFAQYLYDTRVLLKQGSREMHKFTTLWAQSMPSSPPRSTPLLAHASTLIAPTASRAHLLHSLWRGPSLTLSQSNFVWMFHKLSFVSNARKQWPKLSASMADDPSTLRASATWWEFFLDFRQFCFHVLGSVSGNAFSFIAVSISADLGFGEISCGSIVYVLGLIEGLCLGVIFSADQSFWSCSGLFRGYYDECRGMLLLCFSVVEVILCV